MPKQAQSPVSQPSGKKRTLPEKCRKCAMLLAKQAQTLHGAEGDGCWEPPVCYSRRAYAKNRDRINQTRSRKRQEGELEQLPVEFAPLHQTVFGVLVVYRPVGADTPVHAIGAKIWQGHLKLFGQGSPQVISRDADRFMNIAQGILSDSLTLGSAEDNPDRGFIVLTPQQIAHC